MADTVETQEPQQGKAEQAQDKAQEVAGQAREKAQEAAGEARSRLSEQVDQRSTQAGERISSTGSDLRSVGQELRNQGKDTPARLADQAADRVERVGSYLASRTRTGSCATSRTSAAGSRWRCWPEAWCSASSRRASSRPPAAAATDRGRQGRTARTIPTTRSAPFGR